MNTRFKDILKATGTTNERLREVLTAQPPDDLIDSESEEYKAKEKDYRNRHRLEKSISSRICEGISLSLRHHSRYSAVDLANDTDIITGERYPLTLLAKGKISVEKCVDMLGDVSPTSVQKYVKFDGNNKGIMSLPDFTDAPINIVKGFTDRRWAPQKTKFENLYPHLKYEPRKTGSVAELKADATSQVMEIMADNFGYRHFDSQLILNGLLYANTVAFVTRGWTRELEYVAENEPTKDDPDGVRLVSRISREGVDFALPHASRVCCDPAYHVSALNHDNGPNWIFYWDVRRFRDITHNPEYFNKDNIATDSDLWPMFRSYPEYFNQYLDTITPPETRAEDPALANDRKSGVGFYATEREDESIFLTEYFEKIVPLDYGIGNYAYPIWTRFVVAGDSRVVFAEFLPSRPGYVLSINEHDGRDKSVSFAMSLLPYQDHASNIVTHTLKLLAIELFKIIEIDVDRLFTGDGREDEKETFLKEVRAIFTSESFFRNPGPKVIESALGRLRELTGGDAGSLLRIHELRVSGSIAAGLNALNQLLGLAERLLSMSPHEQGQPAEREISAREVTAIDRTTIAVNNAISDAVDEARAAKKRILHESFLACAADTFEVPVASRYPDDVVKAAGFEIVPDQEPMRDGEGGQPQRRDATRRTVRGNKSALDGPLSYTSRDGSERASNPQMAQALAQLIQFIFNEPSGSVLQALGKPRLFEMINTLYRMMDVGFDLNLQLEPGEDETFGQSSQDALTEVIGRITEQLKMHEDVIANNSSQLEQVIGVISGNAPQAAQGGQS